MILLPRSLKLKSCVRYRPLQSGVLHPSFLYHRCSIESLVQEGTSIHKWKCKEGWYYTNIIFKYTGMWSLLGLGVFLLISSWKLYVVVRDSDFRVWEGETGGSWVQCQPGCQEALSQKAKSFASCRVRGTWLCTVCIQARLCKLSSNVLCRDAHTFTCGLGPCRVQTGIPPVCFPQELSDSYLEWPWKSFVLLLWRKDIGF